MIEYIKQQMEQFKKDYPTITIIEYRIDEWSYKQIKTKNIDGIQVTIDKELIKQKCRIVSKDGITKIINLIYARGE